MNQPRDPEARLAAWLEEGPTSGPDEGVSNVQARVRSTRQRPEWLVTLKGGTMETTWRARPVLTARLAFILLISLLVLALTAGTVVVGGQLIRLMGPSNELPAAAVLPPTACPAGTVLKSGDIATIAGTGVQGHSGDGGPAIAATISTQYSGGLAVDATGAIFLSDTGNHVIRRIGLDGVITQVAGTGVAGFSGDGGPASAAALTSPAGLLFDAAGDLIFVDSGRIREIDTAGTITTIAGTGTTIASSGNEGPATAAAINAGQIGIGHDGSLYIDDTNNFRRIGPDGIIHAFAGTGVAGYSGDGGPALDAQFGEVNGEAVDANGDVFLGDAGGHRVRKVDPAGIITTFAGTGEDGYSGDAGPAVAATLGYPGSLVVSSAGDLYVSDWTHSVVRKVGTDGIMTTVAGTGSAGSLGDCGPARTASLSFGTSLALHDGVLYIMDSNDYRVRMIVP